VSTAKLRLHVRGGVKESFGWGVIVIFMESVHVDSGEKKNVWNWMGSCEIIPLINYSRDSGKRE
jgi:hypothetical protein